MKQLILTAILLASVNAFADASAVLNWMQSFNASPVHGHMDGKDQTRRPNNRTCELNVYRTDESHGFAYISLCSRAFPGDPYDNCIGTSINPDRSVMQGTYIVKIMEASTSNVRIETVQDEVDNGSNLAESFLIDLRLLLAKALHRTGAPEPSLYNVDNDLRIALGPDGKILSAIGHSSAHRSINCDFTQVVQTADGIVSYETILQSPKRVVLNKPTVTFRGQKLPLTYNYGLKSTLNSICKLSGYGAGQVVLFGNATGTGDEPAGYFDNQGQLQTTMVSPRLQISAVVCGL